MKIFKKVPSIDFMGKRKIGFIISVLLIVISIAGVFTKGVKYGIDFRGGTIIQVKFEAEPALQDVRALFVKALSSTVNITRFGDVENNEIMITLSQEEVMEKTDDLSGFVSQVLKEKFERFEIRRIETVGPKVGNELKQKSVYAGLYAFLGILIYIGFRFKVQYGLAALAAIFHDVTITIGLFVIFDKEFNLTIMAAVLTIIGYSLNDTIVVFDRIRENVSRYPKKQFESVVNISINESLSRTILTSVTTFCVVMALFILGGDIIHDFSFAMAIGLVVGTYSSIFVASPILKYLSPAFLKGISK